MKVSCCVQQKESHPVEQSLQSGILNAIQHVKGHKIKRSNPCSKFMEIFNDIRPTQLIGYGDNLQFGEAQIDKTWFKATSHK